MKSKCKAYPQSSQMKESLRGHHNERRSWIASMISSKQDDEDGTVRDGFVEFKTLVLCCCVVGSEMPDCNGDDELEDNLVRVSLVAGM